MEEGSSNAAASENCAETNSAETNSARENSEEVEKRFDEDALPVPLEDVESLTGGVDENDERTVEFPWDEEARRARVAPKPIKFDGGFV